MGLADGRVERVLRGFGDIRGREARVALSLSAFFFLITATFYIVKPVKESFLIGVKPSWWPYADLVTALLIGFVVALNARLLARLPRQTYLTASLLFFIAGILVFWFVFDVHQRSLVTTPVADPSGIFFLLWAQAMIFRFYSVLVIAFCFLTDIFIAMSVTQFWIAVNDVFDPHQAKRLVGLFVSGGLFGGIAGSAVAALMTFARIIDPEDLLLVCPALLVLALVTVNLVFAGRTKTDAPAAGRPAPSVKVGYLESFRAVARSRYLLLLAGMLGAAMVVASLVNYQFKTVLKSVYETDQTRTSAIAVFFLVILAVSTVFHLLTTGRVLKSYGIRWAISVAPACLLLGTAAVFLIPLGAILAWAWVVRGGDKTFDNTLSQSVRELLYVPVAPEVKYRAKIFIDMFVNKFATGLGAALFLVLYHARQFDYRADQPLAIIRETGLVTLVFAGLWLVLTRLVYRGYPAVLKKDLAQLWKDGQEVVDAHIDETLVREVFEAIQSRERSTTLYYMNVFNLVRRKNLTPELKELLGIKSDEIKARAMDSLFDVGGSVFFPGLEEAIADTEFQKEIDLIFLLPSYQKIMDDRLGAIAASPSEVDRIEAANSICRMAPSSPTMAALSRLLQDPSSEVVLYALNSAAIHRRPDLIPLILRQLANPMTMAEAQAALAAYGPGLEALVARALGSDDEPLEVRRAIPEVLARIGTQKAADILVAELARRREDMEQPLIDALYRLRADCPEIRFREKDLRPELHHLIREACDLVLDPPGPPDEVKALLVIRIRRVFDLLTLMYPREDIVNDYQNILQGTSRSADYSLEHLDNLLDREDKELLFPLLEDLPAEERAQRLKKALRLK
jgi:AAA family ATP:ADP antiporter